MSQCKIIVSILSPCRPSAHADELQSIESGINWFPHMRFTTLSPRLRPRRQSISPTLNHLAQRNIPGQYFRLKKQKVVEQFQSSSSEANGPADIVTMQEVLTMQKVEAKYATRPTFASKLTGLALL